MSEVTHGPILLVESDAASREILARVLARASLPFVEVAGQNSLIDACIQTQPAVVLLDVSSADGLEKLAQFRKDDRTREVPVIVLVDNDASLERAFAVGADEFARKPLNEFELVGRLRGIYRLGGAMRALSKKERDAQLVLEITRTLASNLDFRSILVTVVQRIAEVARIDRVSIVLVRENTGTGYVVAASDDPELRDLPIELAKYPEIQHVLTTGVPFVILDAAVHPLLDQVRRSNPGGLTFSSLGILPIIYESRAMGVLFLRTKERDALAEHEVKLCVTITSAMAIALRNARVLQSLRDQTQEVTVARFEAERRLRSLQRYADFFESSADGTVVLDAQGRFLFSNPKARELTGYSEKDLHVGGRTATFIDQESIPLARELAAGFGRGEYPRGVDVVVKRADSQRIIINANFSAVVGEEGVVLCSFRDVTKERAVAQQLAATRVFLQRVIDSSVDAIISADMKGRVVVFNHAAERIYRRTAAQMLGTHVNDMYPPGVAKELMRLIRSGDGRLEGRSVEIIDSLGETVPVSISAALILDGTTPVGTVGVFTDLRERRRMEKRLQLAQDKIIEQERQAFVASLAGAAAHELNQPLQSVMAYGESLRRKLTDQPVLLGTAEVILREAERMAEIVKKIGRITKYETKSYVGQTVILDIDKSIGTPSEGVPSIQESLHQGKGKGSQ